MGPDEMRTMPGGAIIKTHFNSRDIRFPAISRTANDNCSTIKDCSMFR